MCWVSPEMKSGSNFSESATLLNSKLIRSEENHKVLKRQEAEGHGELVVKNGSWFRPQKKNFTKY